MSSIVIRGITDSPEFAILKATNWIEIHSSSTCSVNPLRISSVRPTVKGAKFRPLRHYNPVEQGYILTSLNSGAIGDVSVEVLASIAGILPVLLPPAPIPVVVIYSSVVVGVFVYKVIKQSRAKTKISFCAAQFFTHLASIDLNSKNIRTKKALSEMYFGAFKDYITALYPDLLFDERIEDTLDFYEKHKMLIYKGGVYRIAKKLRFDDNGHVSFQK